MDIVESLVDEILKNNNSHYRNKHKRRKNYYVIKKKNYSNKKNIDDRLECIYQIKNILDEIEKDLVNEK